MIHKSARSRVEEVHESPPHAGGSAPTGPGFCGRVLPSCRSPRGHAGARARHEQRLGRRGREDVLGRAGRAPAARGRPRPQPARLDLEQDDGLPRELAAAGHLRKAHLPAAQRPKL